MIEVNAGLVVALVTVALVGAASILSGLAQEKFGQVRYLDALRDVEREIASGASPQEAIRNLRRPT